jgi:hypothetical protein
MKRTAVLLAPALLAIAGAQSLLTYSSPNGDVILSARALRMDNLDQGVRRFTLRRDVTASSKSQGLTLRAQRAILTTQPDPRDSRRTTIRSGEAEGAVQMALNQATANLSATSLIASEQLRWIREGGSFRVVSPGKIEAVRNEAGGARVLSMTGASGSARVDEKAVAGRTPLESLDMEGSVRINVLERATQEGKKDSQFSATGDRLAYRRTADGATATLSGNVRVTGTGEAQMELQNVRVLTILLTAAGEFAGFEVPESEEAGTAVFGNLGTGGRG